MMRPIPCLAVALLVTPAAQAQDFPNRFVTIVSPFQAGEPWAPPLNVVSTRR